VRAVLLVVDIVAQAYIHTKIAVIFVLIATIQFVTDVLICAKNVGEQFVADVIKYRMDQYIVKIAMKKKESKMEAKTKLKFSPYAWAKIKYMRDKSRNEVAGFAVSSKESLFYIEDFYTVKQEVGPATFELDDDGVADFYNDMIDADWEPVEFSRILIHTHPGMGVTPSTTDETNFKENFGKCNWAIMFILGDNDNCECVFQSNVEPKFRVSLPVEIDYSRPFRGTNHEAWDKEYETNVEEETTYYGYQSGVYGVGAHRYGAGRGYYGQGCEVWDPKTKTWESYEEDIIWEDDDDDEVRTLCTLNEGFYCNECKECEQIPTSRVGGSQR